MVINNFFLKLYIFIKFIKIGIFKLCLKFFDPLDKQNKQKNFSFLINFIRLILNL